MVAGVLEISDALLARLVADLADAVVIADRDGVIRYWNTAAQRIFGWPADEAVGKTLDMIIPERLRDRHNHGFDNVMITGHTEYGERLLEVPALHREGKPLSIAFTVTLLFDADGTTPRGVAAVIRDDTEGWQQRRVVRAELTELRARLPS